MEVALPPELERLVREKVESGLYLSADEVLHEALRLLDDRDRLRALRLEELRKEVAIGIEQADRGEVAPFDAQATLARVRARRAEDGEGR
jgi:antitoxin ParD1/3/4